MKFHIYYLNSEGDIVDYYTDALTKEEATNNLYSEIYDVDSILTIRSKQY